MTKLVMNRLSVLSALMIAVCGAAVPHSAAEEAKPEKQPDAKPKVELPPEVETKMSEFFTKVGEVKRKLWIEEMKKDIAEMAKTANLDGETVKKLEALASETAGVCLKEWAKKGDDDWREQYAKHPEQGTVEMIDQALANVDEIARSDSPSDLVRPQDHPIWTEGLKSLLSADQLAAWGKALADRKEALLKEVAEVLKAMGDQVRENLVRIRSAKCNEIKLALGLTKERADQLEALTKSVADQGTEDWRKKAEKSVLAMNEEMRKQAAQGRIYLGQDRDELKRQDSLWNDGLTKLLSPEENQRLDTYLQERKARRTRAVAQMLIAELDPTIAFTSKQREQLRPVAERLVSTVPALFPDDPNFYGNSIERSSFFEAGEKAGEKELKEILDPLQLKHWEESCKESTRNGPIQGGRRAIGGPAGAPAAAQKEAGSNTEPEEIQNVISDFFHDQATAELKRALSSMIVRAEDASRISMATPEAAARLQTAARAAAERAVVNWTDRFQENIHQTLTGANAEIIKQRLAGLDEYQYQRPNYAEAQSAILDETMKTELSERQREAWKKEVDARADYRYEAIGALIMAQCDRKILLTSEQFEKLRPMVKQVVKDYNPDIGRMFSSSAFGGGWYLGYMQFLPFGGIPEKDLTDTLSKEQWDALSRSPEYSNAVNYWKHIKENHERRVKGERN